MIINYLLRYPELVFKEWSKKREDNCKFKKKPTKMKIILVYDALFVK